MDQPIPRKEYWAVVLGLVPEKAHDGGWIVLCGESRESGVYGLGDTPEAAILAFESAMGQGGGSSWRTS